MISYRFQPPIAELIPLVQESLNSGKDVKLTVTGNSMYPLFRSGLDKIVLTKKDAYIKYDVVLYRRKSGQYVFHRIMGMKDGAYIMAGDNETNKEYPVFPEECIAVMKSFESRGRQRDVDNPLYRLYTRFWGLIFPFRGIAVKMILALAKFKKMLKK